MSALPIQEGPGPITWLHDWTARLSRAESDLGLTAGTLTIASVDSLTGPGVTIDSPAPTTAATGVTFRLSHSLTTPVDVALTVKVTLSNDDHDQSSLTIGLR